MIAAYHTKLLHRPAQLKEGHKVYIPVEWIEKSHEFAMKFALICNRRLFGRCYEKLMPQIYEALGHHGGVMIGCFIKSSHLLSGMVFPGDIDLLVIPYDSDELLISETLAIEVKIVRARFSRQGKAPNEFGFSQAEGAISHGFPYSAVAHLIISDTSPAEEWQTLLSARVANSETGQLSKPKNVKVDTMPLNLIHRSFGRLKANCTHEALGLVAAYISIGMSGHWEPAGQPATRNEKISLTTLKAINDFYQNNYKQFMDIKKYRT